MRPGNTTQELALVTKKKISNLLSTGLSKDQLLSIQPSFPTDYSSILYIRAGPKVQYQLPYMQNKAFFTKIENPWLP